MNWRILGAVTCSTRGSGIIESIIALTMIVPLTSVLLSLSYLAYSHWSIKWLAREALFCGLEGQQPQKCTSQFTRDLQRLNIWGQITKVTLRSNRGRAEFRAVWFTPLGGIKAIRRQATTSQLLGALP